MTRLESDQPRFPSLTRLRLLRSPPFGIAGRPTAQLPPDFGRIQRHAVLDLFKRHPRETEGCARLNISDDRTALFVPFQNLFGCAPTVAGDKGFDHRINTYRF